MTKPLKDQNNRFSNPWMRKRRFIYLDLIKWKFLSKNPYKEEKKKPVSFTVLKPDFIGLEKDTGHDYMVWLGHSTVFMRINKMRIITDPVFWDVTRFIKRKTPFPVDPTELPKIDFVLISHSHYDHLNTKSIEFLREKHDPVFVSGPGYEDYFKSLNITKYKTLVWWEEFSTNDSDIKIISLPAQHWSKRGFFDTDKMLWMGFLIKGGGKAYCWIGDSGYFDGFKEIGRRFGPMDILLAPIGAYEPRWFMKMNHLNPEEALKAARDLRARLVIPIHWGTFDLSDEPLWLPIKHLREIHDSKKDPALKILEHGGSFVVV